MPYELVDGNCVKKQNGETVKCHDSHEEAVAHLQALQANVRHSDVVEMSMRISKASYNKTENAPMKWAAVDSDIDSDLYDERMSLELYQDFCSRIENNTPVPEEFKSVICEDAWCGGMPYLSIAHFKAGSASINVPGEPISVFIDGSRLKSKGILYDTEMGRRTFNALVDDLYKKKSDPSHKPVRISIGFLDLEHKHIQGAGPEFVFTRSHVGQNCPLCAQGIGGKIYTKGQLIHLAMTRVPVNPRTEMVAERSMDEITTKKQDAASIIGEDLADVLEEKSIASDVLVVRSEGSDPVSEPADIAHCYDSNVGEWREECIKGIMDKYMPEIRKEIGEPVVKSDVMPKALLDVMVAQIYKSNGYEVPVVEDAMAEETVEKMQAGGKTIPHEKFNYEGISGDVDANKTASPIPVKAEGEVADEMDTEAKDKKVEKSALDTSFESLKALIAKAQSGELDTDAINGAFQAMGSEVEKAVKPAPKATDMNDAIAAFKSMLDEALTPIRSDIAVLKAGQVQAPASLTESGVVRSKALSLNYGAAKPEDVIQRSIAPAQPTRKLSQIEQIARRSTGADR